MGVALSYEPTKHCYRDIGAKSSEHQYLSLAFVVETCDFELTNQAAMVFFFFFLFFPNNIFRAGLQRVKKKRNLWKSKNYGQVVL